MAKDLEKGQRPPDEGKWSNTFYLTIFLIANLVILILLAVWILPKLSQAINSKSIKLAPLPLAASLEKIKYQSLFHY